MLVFSRDGSIMTSFVVAVVLEKKSTSVKLKICELVVRCFTPLSTIVQLYHGLPVLLVHIN